MKSLSESLFDKDLVSKCVPISTRDSIKIICNRLSKDFNVKPIDIKDNDDVKEGGAGIIYRILKSGNAGNVQFITKIADRIHRSSIGSMGIGLCLEFYMSGYNSDTTDLCRVNVGWAQYYSNGELSSVQNFTLWDASSSLYLPNLESFSFDTTSANTLLDYISELCRRLYNISKRDKNKICRSMDDYMKKSKCMDNIKAELSNM